VPRTFRDSSSARGCKWVNAILQTGAASLFWKKALREVVLCTSFFGALSAAQTTPNLNFNIPSPGIANSDCGAQVNTNFSVLDSLLSGRSLVPAIKAGSLSTASLNSIQFADQSKGNDCGAKINSADLALGSAGEIWVNQDCGLEWKTAVTLSSGHVLRFVQGNTSVPYVLSAGITMAANSAIVGPPMPMATNTLPAVTLQMANRANLASLITIAGSFAAISNIAVDGNKADNPTAGPNIVITDAVERVDLSHLTTGHSNSSGIKFAGTGGRGASSAKLDHVMSYENSGDGLDCEASADGFINDSELESNGASGLELNDCSSWRINHSDVGANGVNATGGPYAGVYIHGTRSIGARQNIITGGTQFGNDFRDDILIAGYDGGLSALNNQIIGNFFIGSPNRTSKYADIHITDGGGNLIADNYLQKFSTEYGIDLSEGVTGRGSNNVVCGNYLNGFATGVGFHDTQQNLSGCLGGTKIISSPSVPVISSGFGIAPSISADNGTAAFTVTIGPSPSSTGVLSFPTAPTGWQCNAVDVTNPTTGGGYYTKQTALTKSSVTLTGYDRSGIASPWSAGDMLLIRCSAF
jgi:hypothetical protein